VSRDQNVGQNVNIQIHNKSFETVEQFKCSKTTLTNSRDGVVSTVTCYGLEGPGIKSWWG
jgi:hypothetical protein